MTNDNGDNVITFAKRGEVGPRIAPYRVICAVDAEGVMSVTTEGECSDIEAIGTLELAKHMILAGDDEE